MLRLWRTLAKFHFARGDYEKALALFRRVVALGCIPSDKLSLSRILLKTGHFAEAEKVLRGLSQSDLRPEEIIQAKLNLALAIWKQGDLDDAIRRVEAVYADHKVTHVYATLGYLYIEQGDLPKALSFNQEAIEYNSKNAEIRDNLGQCLQELGETERALAIYAEMAKEKTPPFFPEWHFHYGLTLHDAGRREEALLQLRIARNWKITGLSVLTQEKVQAMIDRVESEATGGLEIDESPAEPESLPGETPPEA
jgi:pentatricopeptide repeat protein